MHQHEYDAVYEIAYREARELATRSYDFIDFESDLFNIVLPEIEMTDLAYLEAHEISEACGDAAYDLQRNLAHENQAAYFLP